MSIYNFKKVQVVPSATDFVDIVLSKIQRKTPTVVHAHYQISRIRQFYMRKVKFAQDCFDEKLEHILGDFPKLDEIHPFYADLMNVLYDRDHYKLALGQINTAKHLIDNVAKDYARLLKFGDSLYRCKQLKKAALGRMATIMKRQKDSLAYLEQVRQHLARLPSIDPNTRTLLVCGYPNVGKSSFMNKLTRADVEVQPYAFTTKSLFVGHMDYKYLRWQVIDTPGILDHPLEERNTIEMQSITALAHLRACIMFFIDLSEQCGYSIAEQVKLFHAIKPLFANKPTLLVINKIDVMRPEQLGPNEKALIDEILSDDEVTMVQMSTFTDEGVMDVKTTACDKLLAARVEMKMKGQKVGNILNKLHLSQPVARDDRERPAAIPESAKIRVKYDPNDPNRPKLEKDIEREQGGAGVYNVDLKKVYRLENDEWKYDTIPEIMDGKNVADFVDPEIEAKLDALEREEERLIAEGFYEEEEEMVDEEEQAIRDAASEIKAKKELIVQAHRASKGKNRPVIPKKSQMRTVDDLEKQLSTMGVGADALLDRARSRTRKRARSESRAEDIVREQSMAPSSKKQATSVVRDRSVMGLRNAKQKAVAESMKKKSQTQSNLYAKAGESDRAIQVKKPRHLFAGKRSTGKTDRR
ncbi:small GTP-binding protein domain [Spizellomyces punctatus DAOM BR117]|uniref:Nucleolar GTP-binding protein 1 n=1 Tax=Spizellomyces punctatus (strain DAOM BR117) TaxID=645134 RepID=A0A0L0HTR1_SPIPD|nr:small GTP-binding protein domain [Spizellomyces punctatus DAOM BR117]KND04254.1 small GTP-binding protein domain [Spizellomyces punctatus DAOM BR117]|eukprot:XP_016612293.1 small GTP-binding protein domain [Spizellomyces punctatus DAOM BR117]